MELLKLGGDRAASGRAAIMIACCAAFVTRYGHAFAEERAGETGTTPDIPTTLPVPYAVMVFENQSVASLDWMRVAVPFTLAEKLEAHRRLRPVYGPMVLPPGTPPATVGAADVARYATTVGAEVVFTGSVQRLPNWELELTVQLWRVEQGEARSTASVTRRGDVQRLQRMINEVLDEVCAKSDLAISAEDRPSVQRAPTDDFYAFTLLGRGLIALHGLGHTADLERAEKTLSRTVFIDPNLAEGHRLLAELYLLDGKADKARGRFGYALDLRPRYYAAMSGLARLHHEAGKLESARELYTQMLERRPWDAELRFTLGKLLWETGDVDGSHVELTRVVRVAPRHLAARRILVLIHASRGDDADLIRELEAIARLDPRDVETQLDLGASYAAVGRDDAAIQTYEAIVARSPRHVQALKFLGDLHRRGGNLDRAIDFYRRAHKADERDPRPYFLLGRAYVEAGDDRLAKEIYRRAQRFKRYLPETYNNLGAIFLRQEKYTSAVWYLKRAVSKRPDNARFRYNYALVLSAKNLPGDALAEIGAGLQLAPDHVELNYLRGVVLLRMGDADGARAAFARTLELAPDHRDARHNLALLDQMQRRAVEGEVTTELPEPADDGGALDAGN
jgi:Flp pilus assembly protein TadD